MFKKSANDFYLSRTSGVLQSFFNPYYEQSFSGYGAVSSGRLELQSFGNGENGNSFARGSISAGEHTTKPQQISRLDTIKEWPNAGNREALADKYEDELSIDHFDRETNPFHHHAGMVNDHIPSNNHHYRNIDDWKHGIKGAGDDYEVKCVDHGYDRNSYHLNHHSRQSNLHHYGLEKMYTEVDGGLSYDEEDDEEEVEPPKSVGLLSLFKYSTKLDFILIMLGCLGALINGGSLPWYSYLFGDFVNKIALDTEKDQMMKDIGKVKVKATPKISCSLANLI